MHSSWLPAIFKESRKLLTRIMFERYYFFSIIQRCSRGHKARGQGQEHKKISRPRTDPLEAKAKDQGHRRKCSQKKRSSKFFFRRSLLEETKKKVFADFSQGFWRFPTKFQRFKNSAVLEPRTGQFSRT